MNVEQVILDSSDGFERRILIWQGEPFVCVSDMHHQIDIAKMTLYNVVNNIKRDHPDCVIQVNGNDLQSDACQPVREFGMGGFQKNTMYNFINETGYNLVIQKINPDTIHDTEKKEIIIKHQRGMAEVFTKYRRKEVVDVKSVQPAIHPSMRSPEQVAKDKIDLGIYIADIFNLPKQMMVSMGLAEAAKETGVSFEHYQKCLPAASGSYACAHISARDIGKPYGDDGRRVNKLLAKLGYIYKVGKSWELTDAGKEMGGDYFHFTNEKNEHKGIYVQWPEAIRDVVEKHKDML